MKDKTELCFACQKRFGEHDKYVSMFSALEIMLLKVFTVQKSAKVCS
jgi:hypothetical protein